MLSRIISGVLIISGLILLVGAAGSYELSVIQGEEMLIRSVVSLGLLGAGAALSRRGYYYV